MSRSETSSTPLTDDRLDELEGMNRAGMLAPSSRLVERAIAELRALRAENERMRPVYEAAKAWRVERRKLDVKNEEINRRLRAGETVTVVSTSRSPESRLADVIDAALAKERP